MKKVYLGDGCYAAEGRFKGEIILTAEDGLTATNTIFVDNQILDALAEFRKVLNSGT